MNIPNKKGLNCAFDDVEIHIDDMDSLNLPYFSRSSLVMKHWKKSFVQKEQKVHKNQYFLLRIGNSSCYDLNSDILKLEQYWR